MRRALSFRGSVPPHEQRRLEDRINTLEMFVGGHESDGMRSDIKLIGEAPGIIGRVLANLIDAADVDAGEFTEDLERLTTIEHLVTFS